MPSFADLRASINDNLLVTLCTIGLLGGATIAAATVKIINRVMAAVIDRGLTTIVHGDGNGAPSLAQLAAGQAAIKGVVDVNSGRISHLEAGQERLENGQRKAEQVAAEQAVEVKRLREHGCDMLGSHEQPRRRGTPPGEASP